MSAKQAKRKRKVQRDIVKPEIAIKKINRRPPLGIILILIFSVVSITAFAIAQSAGNNETKTNSIKVSEELRDSIDDEEVTPETWRSIDLEIHKPDGSLAKIGLLRPLWWLKDAQAEVGGAIFLSMPEMGIEGEAKVISIGPCKADSRKGSPGLRVVTGKFTHENATVLDLYFNNNPNEPLGVTPNHPLWSVTRNGWIEAGHLEVGEYLKTKTGIAKLTMRTQRSGRHKVYNLEVHKDHTYYVSNLSILAHNSCFPNKNQLAKKLNMSVDKYHTQVKKIMKKDFPKEMKKLNTTNPDFGISDAGNLLMKNPKTGKSLDTGIPFKYYAD